MLGRVLGTLTLDGIRLFPFQIQQYWTPHSSRAFLPSATLFLNFPKSQRDFLGSWNPQASDRYARTARRAITVMQKAVARAIHSRKTDPLSEQDLAEHFEQYLSEQCIPQDSIAQCVSSLRPQFLIREIPEPVELSEDVEQGPAPIEDFHSDFTCSSSFSEATEKNRDIGVQPQRKTCTDTGTCWSQVFIYVGLARSASERYTGWEIVLPSQGLIISTTITWDWLCRNVQVMTSYADSVRRRMHNM